MFYKTHSVASHENINIKEKPQTYRATTYPRSDENQMLILRIVMSFFMHWFWSLITLFTWSSYRDHGGGDLSTGMLIPPVQFVLPLGCPGVRVCPTNYFVFLKRVMRLIAVFFFIFPFHSQSTRFKKKKYNFHHSIYKGLYLLIIT